MLQTMSQTDIRFLTVSDINKYISYRFDSDDSLKEVYLQGEISNFKYSGKHCYFSLKDSESEISAMFFYPDNIAIKFKPVDGMKVQVCGEIKVYIKKGTYAIRVRKMAQAGIGLLYQQFLDLKEKLQKEGLFDESKKLPIPEYPEKVAVITAATGEAINDIISTFNRRLPLATIKLYPALVQGLNAPADLIRALNLVYKDNDADVIIIGRGGGSFEDLSCFNDEKLARLLFVSKIPTISAVGHEGDYTICDFVASYRAPTPTGAAMKLTKDKNDVSNILVNYSKRLSADIKSKLTLAYNNWKKLSTSYMLVNFNNVLDEKLQKCLNLDARLSQFAPDRFVKRLEDNLEQLEKRLKKAGEYSFEINNNLYNGIACRVKEELILKNIEKCEKEYNVIEKRLLPSYLNNYQNYEAKTLRLIDKIVILNPFSIMKKGYSIVYKDENIISSIDELNVDDDVKIKLYNGYTLAHINKIVKEEK